LLERMAQPRLRGLGMHDRALRPTRGRDARLGGADTSLHRLTITAAAPLRCWFFGVVKALGALADQLVMDPSVGRRADAASRAHLVLAFACLPFVGAAVGALAALAHVAPSTLGAAALAVGVLSGPLAAVALRLSASRAVEPEAVPASPAIV